MTKMEWQELESKVLKLRQGIKKRCRRQHGPTHWYLLLGREWSWVPWACMPRVAAAPQAERTPTVVGTEQNKQGCCVLRPRHSVPFLHLYLCIPISYGMGLACGRMIAQGAKLSVIALMWGNEGELFSVCETTSELCNVRFRTTGYLMPYVQKSVLWGSTSMPTP